MPQQQSKRKRRYIFAILLILGVFIEYAKVDEVLDMEEDVTLPTVVRDDEVSQLVAVLKSHCHSSGHGAEGPLE